MLKKDTFFKPLEILQELSFNDNLEFEKIILEEVRNFKTMEPREIVFLNDTVDLFILNNVENKIFTNIKLKKRIENDGITGLNFEHV